MATLQREERVRWRRRADGDEVLRVIGKLVEREPDHQVALCVRLRGQRMTEVAKEYGYTDGNGVHQVIKRLEGKGEKGSSAV